MEHHADCIRFAPALTNGGGGRREKGHNGKMPGWLDKLKRPAARKGAEERLLGVPAVRRLKNYAAFSGYVYEYCFEGYRDRRGSREFVFSVSGNRKSWFPFEVHIDAGATAVWEGERGIVLGDRERYALAKLALFSVFDDRANPSELRGSFDVTPAIAAGLLEKLDL